MSEDGEHWKQFQGSELGSLLSSIYGRPHANIKYPKLATRQTESKDIWRPISNKPGAVDPRNATRREVGLEVPKMRGGRTFSRPALIDCIPKRRNETEIRGELETIKMQQTHYRPAHFAARGDAEKERISEIFTYRGGKGLPEELTVPVQQETPFERIQKLKSKTDNSKYTIVKGQKYLTTPSAGLMRAKENNKSHNEVIY